jgi:hypothetical protein
MASSAGARRLSRTVRNAPSACRRPSRNFHGITRLRPLPRKGDGPRKNSVNGKTTSGGMGAARGTEIDPGSGPSMAIPRSPEKPRPVQRKKQAGWKPNTVTDEVAVLRARIASHFYLLRRAEEGTIRQDYAFRIAAAMCSGQGSEVTHTTDRLAEERDAVLNAVAAKSAAQEKDQSDREIASLRRRRREARGRAQIAARLDVSQFRKVAVQIGTRLLLNPVRPPQAHRSRYGELRR